MRDRGRLYCYATPIGADPQGQGGRQESVTKYKETNEWGECIGWIRGFLFLRKFYFTCLKFTMYFSSSALHLCSSTEFVEKT